MQLFSREPQKLQLPGANVTYYPNFLTLEEATHYFKTIYEETQWQQDDIKVFGKVYPQPRLTALYATNSLPYSYSNITMYPKAFTFALSEIKKKVEAITTTEFTTCLINLYRDGKDSNGWHADDEKELGKNPTIASVSLGASRVFKFRDKKAKSSVHSMSLEHGSLLLMKDATQHNWQHQVPKTSKFVEPRINLTFRTIKG
ncbi:alpha-ketoglutarate-dependent dioxygenase AlkB [Dokdonia pacifica]|uniref:Alkylated DNA repair dioxygenase AlkB n=1 Tax=Dokdonia pacifica TaxID=1627892 RepID=A0A239D793_9FLAO|nr:alpha-ketoglutarate-dependent dioxygenase AlkB [Dokdonia pacifica]GGG40571.1 alpha-ketoglutarate-dependent dioxygenase AlkB [Dokdonia pacifica]SNS28042.1 Alkylated DNA repair dioxygenase AlkB [Dokdonia pacifica]